MGFLDRLLSRNVLYYPGCLTKFVLKDIEKKYKRILRKCGIDFIRLKDLEVCCGSPVLNAGYTKDFVKLKKKNLKLFKEHGIRKIITSCPACYYTFKKYYKIDVEHITQTIFKNKNYGDHEELGTEGSGTTCGSVAYHDPCHLGRHSGIYDEPRNILKSIGFKVIELQDNKEKALCCGAGAGVKTNYPDLANRIAKKRLEQCKTTKLVTTCPLCYKHLQENSKNIKVLEFSELLNGKIK
jgi:Fe-S oxidoreductase